jgi:hypothetical protein
MIRRSQRTVERSVATLEKDGWIAVHRGVGRGNFSNYEINVGKFKERQAVAYCEEKERQRGNEKATPKTTKGDSGGSVKGRTIIEPSEETPTSLAVLALPLSKHTSFKQEIKEYWDAAHDGTDIEMPWGGAEAAQLKRFIAENPKLTVTGLHRLLVNRVNSEVNHSERPCKFIPKLIEYARGPLNTFKQPANGSSQKKIEMEKMNHESASAGDIAWRNVFGDRPRNLPVDRVLSAQGGTVLESTDPAGTGAGVV